MGRGSKGPQLRAGNMCKVNREREARIAAFGGCFSGTDLLSIELPQYVVIDSRGNIHIDALEDVYSFELSRVATPLHLLDWLRHLDGKYWMTEGRTGELINAVCEAKGWQLPDS